MTRFWMVMAIALSALACSGRAGPVSDASDLVKLRSIYGSDDRQEYFESSSDQRAVVARATVALVSNRLLSSLGGDLSSAATWGKTANLCADQRYSQQPSAAFCSGVLVDWDLVLSAGHCARAFATEDFSVIFDFYYASPGVLASRPESVYGVDSIVDERLDDASSNPRLDYVWLRLKKRVDSSRQPVPVYTSATGLENGDPIVSIGNGGGIPTKVDNGGHVVDARHASNDYFTADIDNFEGSSGGPVFDSSMTLVGVAARGGEDYSDAASGCRTETIIAEDKVVSSAEEVTFVHRAVGDLCQLDPAATSVCRADCGNPCVAASEPVYGVAGGCSIGRFGRSGSTNVEAAILVLLASVVLSRRRSCLEHAAAGRSISNAAQIPTLFQ